MQSIDYTTQSVTTRIIMIVEIIIVMMASATASIGMYLNTLIAYKTRNIESTWKIMIKDISITVC